MTAMKRVLAIFVTILMIISVVPVLSGTAYAADRYNIVIPADQTEGLMSGMFADVTFLTDTRNDTVTIPTEAIQTGVDGSYVYILDSDNIAHRVSVETGLVGDGVTEVTSGLAEGDALVTVGQFYLSEGTQARVVPHQQGD